MCRLYVNDELDLLISSQACLTVLAQLKFQPVEVICILTYANVITAAFAFKASFHQATRLCNGFAILISFMYRRHELHRAVQVDCSSM